VPFHAWLPDAYPAAPAPISALLSGTVSKVLGVYVLARLLFNVFGVDDDTLMLIRWIGGITMVVGGLLALGQWDIKRLLAYSSISQVGLIVLALSFGTTWGMVGALYHFLNHAVFKPLLFLGSGQVETVAGTRDLREMHELGRAIPITASTSMVASLSISGVPPFNGFWSKLIIVVAAIQTHHIGWAIAVVLMSIVTLTYQLRLQKQAFYGTGGSRQDQSFEMDSGSATDTSSARSAEPIFIALPMVLLAVGCLALSLLVVTGLKQPILVGPAAEVLMKGTKIW